MSEQHQQPEGARALRTGVGVRRLPHRSHVDATDRHHARFIHNMSTCDIKGLSSGQGAFGLAVDRGGKLVGQFFADVEADGIRVEVDARRREAIVAHWTSHRIADMVRFAGVNDLAVIAAAGPEAGALMSGLCGDAVSALAPLSWAETVIADVACRVRRNDERLAMPGWDITVDEGSADALLAALVQAGAVVVSGGWDAVRVANGVPDDRVDMNEENIPLESDHLTRAISWDKGCYIGQEVIARMHYRGKPNRHLRGLRVTAGALPSTGAALVAAEGKEVGVVGTVVEVSEEGGAIALAVIKRHFAAPGTVLTTSDGSEATVAALPFAAQAD